MYKSTKNHTNADALSRLPMKSNEYDEPDASDIFNIEQIENLPVTAMEIARETKRNPMLSCVYQHVTSGWKKPEDTYLMLFYNRRDEITTQHGCLMW